MTMHLTVNLCLKDSETGVNFLHQSQSEFSMHDFKRRKIQIIIHS